MLRRGFALNAVLPLTVLVISIGIDIRGIWLRPSRCAEPDVNTAFPLPGPRRYPPNYHTAALTLPDAPGSTNTSH